MEVWGIFSVDESYEVPITLKLCSDTLYHSKTVARDACYAAFEKYRNLEPDYTEIIATDTPDEFVYIKKGGYHVRFKIMPLEVDTSDLNDGFNYILRKSSDLRSEADHIKYCVWDIINNKTILEKVDTFEELLGTVNAIIMTSECLRNCANSNLKSDDKTHKEVLK